MLATMILLEVELRCPCTDDSSNSLRLTKAFRTDVGSRLNKEGRDGISENASPTLLPKLKVDTTDGWIVIVLEITSFSPEALGLVIKLGCGRLGNSVMKEPPLSVSTGST